MLITAAPARTARAIARAESEQRICCPFGSGTLSARAPGQMPSIPTPLAGAAATVAVAVPWKSASGPPPSVVMFDPAISGWVASRTVSTSAISGLVGATGGATAPPTTKSRQPACADSGSGAWVGRAIRFGSAKSSSPCARRAAASGRARSRATSQAPPAIRRAPAARAIRSPAARSPRAATIHVAGSASTRGRGGHARQRHARGGRRAVEPGGRGRGGQGQRRERRERRGQGPSGHPAQGRTPSASAVSARTARTSAGAGR